jgi:hypothetical protein
MRGFTMASLALSLSLGSGLACASPGKIEKALARGAASKAPCTGLVARYAVGGGFHGRTLVTVKGSAVEVLHTERGDQNKRVYNGQLDGAGCGKLLRAAYAGKLWKVVSKQKTGVPEETRPTIAVGVGKDVVRVTLWRRESRKVKVFIALQTQLLALAKRFSKGKVTY